jgi:salicylate hydroxylase
MSGHPLLVAGGGIAGLTAALMLARSGHRVTVIEQAAEPTEVGAGIQISPNASRILIDLGLRPALERVAVTPEDLRVYSTRAGGEIGRTLLGGEVERRWRAPLWVIHRADLARVLTEAVHATPGIDLVHDARLRDVEPLPGGIRAFVTIASEPHELDVAGLIGADGVRSGVRTRVRGGPPARYAGRTAYRATVEIDRVPEELRRSTGLWMSPKAHLVHYPIRGGRLFNLVAVVEDDWTDESWSVPASAEEFARRFGLWEPKLWPQPARSLLTLPAAWTKWALCGFDCRFEWSSGPVTLIGDAAHATLPFAAQGGGMAIEDAAVLAGTLEAAPNPAAAFRAYEALRKARVRAIVETARKNGRLYHLGGTTGFFRDLVLKLGAGSRLTERHDWIWSWRPSDLRKPRDILAGPAPAP